MDTQFPSCRQCFVFFLVIATLIGAQLMLNTFGYFHCSLNESFISEQLINNTHPHSSTQSTTQRVVMSLTAVPSEIPKMVNETINNLLFKQSYTVDVIYLNIPYIQLRNNNALYPSTFSSRPRP